MNRRIFAEMFILIIDIHTHSQDAAKKNEFQFIILARLNIALLSPVVFMTLNCSSQVNLAKELSQAANPKYDLEYLDSSGNEYRRGLYSGMGVDFLFYNVVFNSHTKRVKVEVIATVYAGKTDTVGYGNVRYFLAQPKKFYLTKIRELGKTNDPYTADSLIQEGYFSFDAAVDKDDRLYFVDGAGTGLIEYYIDKTCFELLTPKKKKKK